jgi:methionyl-tRNA formyltransferase
MRIIFMGSPDFAVPTLDALVEAGHDVVAVYTQPPRPAGRGKGERPTAVDERAGELGIEVRCPKSLQSEVEQESFAELDADVAVVAAYGLILPQPILDAPIFGCLNVHGSLLPRWRGAAPVQRAIMAGDEVTGITIMQMEAGLDTGPMLLKRVVDIEDKNAAQLTDELAKLGAAMMVEVLAVEGARGHGVPGEVLDDRLTIACGKGALRPTLLQRASKGAMSTGELLRGFPIPAGTRLE